MNILISIHSVGYLINPQYATHEQLGAIYMLFINYNTQTPRLNNINVTTTMFVLGWELDTQPTAQKAEVLSTELGGQS